MDSSQTMISLSEAIEDVNVDTLLVTANVGSLFEDPKRILRPWLNVFLQKVSDLGPKFLALHLQEVGGKTYEKSMQYVQEFINCLCEAPEMQDFEYVRVFMDEDFESAENFTALGNLYFIHKTLKNTRVWNFLTHSWEMAEGKHIYTGNIETVATKDKSKFPQHFFPECKWSRKGFMRTRWEVNKTVFDLVNIHLFHDASNLAAIEEYPSVYCKTRRRALLYTLEKFRLDDINGFAPFFLFGDFNFRCDTEGVVKELTENLSAHRVQCMKSDSTKVQYRNSLGDNIFTVGKKVFNHVEHQFKFKESWLKKYDRELEPLRDLLYEFTVNFSPSYPYEEAPDMPTDFMSTRCPSWCDRVLLSPQALTITNEKESQKEYHMIGENICMGDHKPVYLKLSIKSNQGTNVYCNCDRLNVRINKSTTHHSISIVCSTCGFLQSSYCPCSFEMIQKLLVGCKPINKVTKEPYKRDSQNVILVSKHWVEENNVVNRINSQHLNANFDHNQRLQDPYTPESTVSHSPCPERNCNSSNSHNSQTLNSEDKQYLDKNCFGCGHQTAIGYSAQNLAHDSNQSTDNIYKLRTVSAGQLKFRLEELQESSQLSFKFHNNNCCDAVKSDVEEIDSIFIENTEPVQWYTKKCFPKCCSIL